MPSSPAPHPDLRLGPWLPRRVVYARAVPVLNALSRMGLALVRSPGTRHAVSDDVDVWVYGTTHPATPRPALLWLHGGGYVIGHPRDDERWLQHVATTLGILVVSVDYRLAPRHPFPTPVEDAYAALQWLDARDDVTRIAIGGRSAGAGLAAGLALLTRERAEPELALQLLAYPMLDDRSSERATTDDRAMRLWSRASNRFGWHAYLGGADPTSLPPWAVPGRCNHLKGLPPAWIGVGSLDLFAEECEAYAARLEASGVSCSLDVVPGAYHGFDVADAGAAVSRQFVAGAEAALAEALGVSASGA